MKKSLKVTRLVSGTADITSMFSPLHHVASPRERIRAGDVNFAVKRGRRAWATACAVAWERAAGALSRTPPWDSHLEPRVNGA